MIKPEEIKQKSSELLIEIDNVQRDYVFGWLLAGIFKASSLKDKLALKGGNAFRKAYFQDFRFSADLDFSTPRDIPHTELLKGLNEACKFAEQFAQIQFDYNRNKVDPEPIIQGHKQIYKAKLYFLNFMNKKAECDISIRVDISEFDKNILPIQDKGLIHPYSDMESLQAQIRTIKMEEMLADKLKLLLQRRHAYDFYDLVHATILNKTVELDRKQVIATFLKKTIFEQSPVAAMKLLIAMPFEYIKGYWQKISAPKQGQIALDKAEGEYELIIRNLFEDFQYGEGQALAFFPAWIRNPILRAGFERTQLRVTYDGLERMVEPYSLVYKRRNDGVAQEYLYVHDNTGGRSGTQGIKAFLNNKITQIENTEEKFEPRHTVEISKAGEHTDKTYFGSPFSSGRTLRRRSSRRRLTASYGPRYVVQCSYCGKKFTRKRYSTVLNSHKDKSGYPCLSRYGTVVETKTY